MKNVFLAGGVSCSQDRKPAIWWFLGLKGKVLKPSVAIFGMVRRSQRDALSTSPMNCGGDTRTTEAAIRKGHGKRVSTICLSSQTDHTIGKQHVKALYCGRLSSKGIWSLQTADLLTVPEGGETWHHVSKSGQKMVPFSVSTLSMAHLCEPLCGFLSAFRDIQAVAHFLGGLL